MRILQNRTTSMSKTKDFRTFLTEHKSFLLMVAVCIVVGVDPTEVFASSTTAFDLNKAVGGMVTPVMKTIDDHWGKALLAMGAVGAVVAQGDLKTRMVGLGTGVAGGGLLMAAIKLGAGIS